MIELKGNLSQRAKQLEFATMWETMELVPAPQGLSPSMADALIYTQRIHDVFSIPSMMFVKK